MSEQNQQPPASDPSISAWSSLAPRAGAPIQPSAEEPPQNDWRWGWSPWVGIHYGPIPVGILLAIPILIALRL
ncbi:MAG: hypothetical protein JNL83_30130 [Myxococcales bacterium]|nr:hypothetical protein [Myxococcales bacterium]